jgi:hypothetical protein
LMDYWLIDGGGCGGNGGGQERICHAREVMLGSI